MEYKKYNKLMNKTTRNRLTDIKNKLVVTSGEREGGRGNIGLEGKRIIMGLYEIMCVKLLKIIKHYRIERIFHSIKKGIKKERKHLPNLKKLLLSTVANSSNNLRTDFILCFY